VAASTWCMPWAITLLLIDSLVASSFGFGAALAEAD
jgi:uncharacterized membrane protein YtjA (UPF0391 family)